MPISNFSGLDQVGLTGSVRVRVDATFWTLDPNQSDQRPEAGGDPQTGTYNILDTTMSSNGSFTVPIHRIDHNNGYRIIISPAAAAVPYPTKYEAENSALQNADTQQGSANVSGGQYVSLAQEESSASFIVTAEKAGTYIVYARYATGNAEAGEEHIKVGNANQGLIYYPVTSGGPAQEFAFTSKRIVLNAGSNRVTLGYKNGPIALDYIDVRPDTHRYEAEYAATNEVTPGYYKYESLVPDFIGGINDTSANVTFAMDAPQKGTYLFSVNYANGISGDSAIDDVFVNGNDVGQISLPYTNSFTAAEDPRLAEQAATMQLTLNEGVNQVRLQKNTLYAELDFANITPIAFASGSSISINPGMLTFPSQPEGTTSETQTISLSNLGNSVLTIRNIATTRGFTATKNCEGTLAAGAACQIAVTFTPTSVGAQSGTLTLFDSAGGSPQAISLSGSGERRKHLNSE